MPSPVEIPELRLETVQAWKIDIIRLFRELSAQLSHLHDDNLAEIERLFQQLKAIYEIANHQRCSPMSAEIEEDIIEARKIIAFIHNTKNKMINAYDFFLGKRTAEAQILVSSLQYEDMILNESNQTLEFMMLHFEDLKKAFPDHTISITMSESAKEITGFREGLVAIHSTIENLLMNAIQYAGKAGPIELLIKQIDESSIQVGVKDHSMETLAEKILTKINTSEETLDKKSLSPPRSSGKGSPTSWGMGLAQSFSELRLLFDPVQVELSQSPFDETSGTKTLSFELPIHDGRLSLTSRSPSSSHSGTPARPPSHTAIPHPERSSKLPQLGMALAFMTQPPPDVIKPAPTSPAMRGMDPTLKPFPTTYAFVLIEDDRTNSALVNRTFNRAPKSSLWTFFHYENYESCIDSFKEPTFQTTYAKWIIGIDSTVSGAMSGIDFLTWTLSPEASFLKGKCELVWYSDPIAGQEDFFRKTACRMSGSKNNALCIGNMTALIAESEGPRDPSLDDWTLSHP
jgi:hypothetical protein